jgi:hypothetical protein
MINPSIIHSHGLFELFYTDEDLHLEILFETEVTDEIHK